MPERSAPVRRIAAAFCLVTAAWCATPAAAAPGDIRSLGTLGGSYSFGFAISDAGHVTGFSQLPGLNAGPHAFRYTPGPGGGGTMAPLGTLGGMSSNGYSV